MKLVPIGVFAALIVAPHFVFAEEHDKPVKFQELPAEVAKAIKSAAGDAELTKITLGNEDGKPAYEAVWNANGHKHEISVATDGKVIDIEEILSIEEAPAAVQAAIAKEGSETKVTKVEKVLENGKTHYEAVIKTAKFEGEVEWSETGEVLKREKKEKEEKEEKSEKSEKKDKKE